MSVHNSNSQIHLDGVGKQPKEKQKQNQPIVPLSQYVWERKEQPIIFYSLCLLCYAYTSFQIYVLLYSNTDLFKGGISLTIRYIIIYSVRITILFINSCYIGGIKGIFFSYTMIDGLGILTLCNAGMYLAVQLSVSIPLKIQQNSMQISLNVLSILNYIIMTGNFRLMIKTCLWNKVRLLIFKTILYFCCGFSIYFGVYSSMNKVSDNFKCTQCIPNGSCQDGCQNGEECCYDIENTLKAGLSKMSDFVVMITATSFAYNSQLISLLSNDSILDLHVYENLRLQEESELRQKTDEPLQKQKNERKRQEFQSFN